ncbi:hypothetical protein [Ferruginibacter albus]|uniref:hypothetical protein n=1 Tax=Ferruginibacter albus TaxID=2875540 RepID=UPI001CC357E0|nr:hypothetical protein [Ferruginibacter albus]UAY51733.1 hypothetical protein K9M53_14195 [Ferruginibacter albus]
MKNHLHPLMKKGIFALALCLCLFTKSFSQHFIFGNENFKAEVGLNFGPTFFLGDLGGGKGYGTKFVKDINLSVTKLMKGGFVSVYPNNWLGFRLAGQYTYVEGRDDLIHNYGSDELYRKQRNLDFKSDIWEVYGAVELFPLMLMHQNMGDDYAPRLRPYLFAGVGAFHFNPVGSLTNPDGSTTWYDLKPLHTEGEGFAEYPDRKEYSLTQMNIPYGGGLKYFVSDRTNISLEVLYRKTFTDYIDDVSTYYIDPSLFDKYLSPADAAIAKKINDKTDGIYVAGSSRYTPGVQRGNPNNTDAYFSFLFKIGFRLGPIYESSFERRAMRQTSCPHRY